MTQWLTQRLRMFFNTVPQPKTVFEITSKLTPEAGAAVGVLPLFVHPLKIGLESICFGGA